MKRYYVVWLSCDGSGQTPVDTPFESLADAVAESDRQAGLSNGCRSDGWVNPWDYSYRVVDERYETLHRSPYVKASRVAA